MTLAEMNSLFIAVANREEVNPKGTVRIGNLPDVQNQRMTLPLIVVTSSAISPVAPYGNVVRNVYSFTALFLCGDWTGKSIDAHDAGPGRDARQYVIERADAIRRAFMLYLNAGVPTDVVFEAGPTSQVNLQGNISITGYQATFTLTTTDQLCG
jgi:hypothetical protein